MLLLSTVLVVLLFDRIVKRLQVLTDNLRRLADGTPLHPPLGGGDELARLDRTFRETAASLDEKKQENEMFVYSVSHDLRSPLINLLGFSEELRASAQDLLRLFEHPDMPGGLKQARSKNPQEQRCRIRRLSPGGGRSLVPDHRRPLAAFTGRPRTIRVAAGRCRCGGSQGRCRA